MDDYRNCVDCEKIITFREFCRDNPLLKKSTAKDFWNNRLYSIYCSECFYNRPERPFKVRRARERSYFKKISIQ